MRPPLRLLPLSLSIAACLSGPAFAAEDKPLNWALCPAGDIIPPFNGAPPAAQPGDPDREEQPTVIDSDEQQGTRTTPQFLGNVALARGDQFHWAKGPLGAAWGWRMWMAPAIADLRAVA